MKEYYLRCACHHPEHLAILSYDESEPEMYFHIHLARDKFLHRFATAFWHILGRESKTGCFTEIVLTPDSAHDLIDFIFKFANGASHE